jgi:hypothetical protein
MPCGASLSDSSREPGDDDETVADRLVERNRVAELVVLHQVERRVPAEAGEAGHVEDRLQLFGAVLRGTRELDALVTHLGDRLERAAHVVRQLVADRPQFQSDRQLCHDATPCRLPGPGPDDGKTC